MYLATAHDGTGSSGEKGGAASRHRRIGQHPSFTSACASHSLPTLFSASRCSPGTHSSIRSQSSPPQHPGPNTRAWEPATREILRLLYFSSSAAATASSSALLFHPTLPSTLLQPTHALGPAFSSCPISSPPTPPPTSRTLSSSSATVAAFQSHLNQPVGSVASQPNFSDPSLATSRVLSSLF
jgi:hypothetical protein